MAQTLFIDYERQSVDQKLIEKSPETALKSMIAQHTKGNANADLLHSIVRAVIPRNDNSLKRLLYYYLETVADDRSLVVCMNQISKDLESPNEYIRGNVLRFISHLGSMEFVSILLKGVSKNLSSKSPFVRMRAAACLTELSERFNIDIDEELCFAASQEANSAVQCVLFDSMHRLGISLDAYLNPEYPEETLLCLLRHVDDIPFTVACLSSRHSKVIFRASARLLALFAEGAFIEGVDLSGLGISSSDPDGQRLAALRNICTDNIFAVLSSDSSVRPSFLPVVPVIEGHALDLLCLIDPYDLGLSKALIERAFITAETHEFVRVAECLYGKYRETGTVSDKKVRFCVMLLESMASFAESHCVYAQEMVQEAMKNIGSAKACGQGGLELIYASIKFLSAVVRTGGDASKQVLIVDHLITAFPQMKHGKLLRLAFDAITAEITEEQFDGLLDVLLDGLEKGADYLLAGEVYAGTHIALALAEANRTEWACKAKLLGVLVRLLQFGTKSNVIDESSKSTISTCIRAVVNNREIQRPGGGRFVEFKRRQVTEPVYFSLLGSAPSLPRFSLKAQAEAPVETVQLSGLCDPLYVEANVSFNRYELSLDILLINQTDAYLQDITFDFTTSKYVSLEAPPKTVSLQPSSATTLRAHFSIQESGNCFVAASVYFKYPRANEYSSAFVQHLNDFTISVGKFLERADVDFREAWTDLEWENIYSLTLRKADQGMLLEAIARATHGTVSNCFQLADFLVANIACYTGRKSLVLANICFSSSGSATIVEVRVRSMEEEIVKSVSNLISQCLKLAN